MKIVLIIVFIFYITTCKFATYVQLASVFKYKRKMMDEHDDV
jgi:hypothetical protein